MKDARAAKTTDVFQVLGPLGAAPRAGGCAWPACAAPGTHRAPVSRARLEEYQWFCLDHVRIYNAAWNYYIGMSEAEVEACIRSDTTWNRPSWPLGGGPGADGGGAFGFDALRDPLGVVGCRPGAPGRPAPPPPRLSAAERRAFGVLELDFPVTFEELKARYKVLVKRHHPDANGGAKDAEERLKRINEAFDTLKSGLFA